MTTQFIKSYPFEEDFFANEWQGEHWYEVEEAYKRWNHLKDKLTSKSSIYEMEDFLVGAKRLINYRTKELFSLYGLKENLSQSAKKGDFYILQELDIARPYLINKLRKIRNEIEHEFTLSVNVEACQDYLDICWYYLRSTDYFFTHPASQLVRLSSSRDISKSEIFHIRFDYKTKMLSFTGLIHRDDITEKSAPNSTEIDIKSQKNVHKDVNILEVKATIIGSETVILNVLKNLFKITSKEV
jgi:hypothetical protein